jgi:hypothetical protein
MEEPPVRLASFMLVSFLLLQVDAEAHDRHRKEACAKVKARIRLVESRMRAGYSARQGYRLEDRLRELRKERARLCR